MGKINQYKLPEQYQFVMFNDKKLRSALVTLANKYDDKIRQIIYRTYNDPKIESLYRGIRELRTYEKGQKDGAHHRKILNFPNRYVWDFCDTVMTALYGGDWLKNDKALKHELVRPWWVVNKL